MIRYELQQELKNIFGQLGKSVVMVTHDIAEAAYFSDSLVLIRGGHVVQSGTFKDLVHRPADSFVKQFITAQCEPMERVTKILK
jgi:osmoprotectant transport system ATP-binding protein